MQLNLSPSVAICAMSRTGQPFCGYDNAVATQINRLTGQSDIWVEGQELSKYETILSINNTHTVNTFVDPDLIIAMDDLQRDVKTEPAYVDAIVNQGCPVLSTGRRKKWPNVQPYPLKAVTLFLEQHFPFPASKLLDCSISFAIALCLAKGVEKIGLFGVDLTAPYRAVDLECGMVNFKHRGYPDAPDWFCYYDDGVLVQRRPREPGWESIHTLIGFGFGRGVELEWMPDSTILNTDRPDFLYGYQEQPK